MSAGKPLRTVARELSIPYTTLALWVRKYRQSGEQVLRSKRVHRRKVPHDTEYRIMFLKEQNPALCVSKAQQLLRKRGINISQGGIWHIWKRYGLAKRSIDDPLSPMCEPTAEAENALIAAKEYIEKNDMRAAADVINSAPCLPPDQSLTQIPYALLSPRRKLDRLHLEFSHIPFPVYRRKVSQLTRVLEKKGYFFSSILADFFELNALDWMEKPEEKMEIFKRLAAKLRNVKSSSLQCLFYLHQAITYCDLLQIKKALRVMRKCRKLIYLLPSSYYLESYASLLTALGNFKEASLMLHRARHKVTAEESIRRLTFKILVAGPTMRGEYTTAQKTLKKVTALEEIAGYSASYNLTQGHVVFGQGRLEEASKYYLASLEKSTKGELYNRLYATSKGLAAVAMGLNRKREAKTFLTKYLPLMKKHGLSRDVLMLEQLLGLDVHIPEDLLHIKTICILDLLRHAQETLKIGDYRRAFDRAQRNGLLGYFHRSVVFFPDIILRMIEMGRPTGLPRTLLKFPLFNQKTPVYQMKFLGALDIMRNQQSVRTRLIPKEKAFLIHLALRAGAPGKSMFVNDICENFWRGSTNPVDRLLHLLSSIKKKIALPSHLLTVSSRHAQTQLINRGFYMTTDYSEFQTLLTQTKTLERAGEWDFAKGEYVRAFTLLRGELFRKMYDPWSEYMREVLRNRIQKEVDNFVRLCHERGHTRDAQKVVDRIKATLRYEIDARAPTDSEPTS